MTTFLRYLCDSIILWIAADESGKILLKSNTMNKVKLYIAIFVFSVIFAIINMCDIEIYHGIIKIVCTYIIQCLFFKIVFKQTVQKCMNLTLVWYICMCISEVIVVLLASLFLSFFHLSPGLLKNNILVNLIIFSYTVFIINKFKSLLISFLSNKYASKIYLPLIAIILIMMSIILFRHPVSKWVFNAEFIITMITLFGFCILVLYLLKQHSDIQKTTSMYQEVVKYSNTTNKVLEDYRMIGHEHSNQLSIIRQLIINDKKEAIEYIDSLIEKRTDIKYKWVSELNKLPLEGLKGLINYKLIEAEENNIRISVIISKEVSKVKLNKLSAVNKDHLYSICGVYLDNAIQAASKSKDKEISLEIYKENKELVFILANTFNGHVDINRIDDYGYTTKGKNHGIGLHLVKSIIDEDSVFSQSRKIIDNSYIEELRVNISKINAKKK